MKSVFVRAVLFILLLGTLQACKSGKEEVVFIENKTFFSFNPEYKKASDFARSVLKKEFKITRIKVENYDNLSVELTKLFEVKKKVILFVEPFAAPLIVHWGGNKNTNCRIITYGLNGEIANSDISVFSMSADEKVLYGLVRNYLVRNTGKNKESVLFLEGGNGISSGFKDTTTDIKNVKTVSLYQNKESSLFRDAIEGKKVKNIVLFSGVSNRVVNATDDKLLHHKNVLEVITEYGVINRFVDSRIVVNYPEILKEGLSSAEFRKFKSSDPTKKLIINYKSKNRNVFKVISNKKKKLL